MVTSPLTNWEIGGAFGQDCGLKVTIAGENAEAAGAVSHPLTREGPLPK